MNTATRNTATLSPAKGAWLVAEREIGTKLRSKAFLVSTGLMLLFTLGIVLFSGFMAASGGFGGPTKVAATSETAELVDTESFVRVAVPDAAAAEQAVRDGEADAAVVPGGEGPLDVTVVGLDSPPADVIQALSVAPAVQVLETADGNAMLGYFVAMIFGVLTYMIAILFGTTIAQSVVEEKQTRIVEILLATVSARTILAGKVIGNSVLALGTVVALLAVGSVGMLATGQDLLLGELGTALIWFGILFAFSFVLIAAMYAAAAVMVSRQEDIGSVTTPVVMLVMIPFFLIIFFNDNPQVISIMSYVPVSAPSAMPLRLFLGDAAWWEPILSLGVLVASIAVVWWLGARIYEGSVLRTGSRVKLGEALKA